MNDDQPPSDGDLSAARRTRSYRRRWWDRAWELTRAFWGVRLPALVLTVVGPTIGFLLFTYSTTGSLTGVGPDQVARVLVGPIGTVVILVLTLLVSLFRAPAVMELESTASQQRAIKLTQSELATVQREVSKLRERLAASKLELDLAHEGRPLRAVNDTDEAKANFLDSERTRLIEPFVAASRRARASFMPDLARDVRSEKHFQADVAEYLSGLEGHWVAALRSGAIRGEHAILRPVVRNLTDTGFERFEIQLRLPVGTGAGWDGDPEWTDDIPFTPEPWGKMTYLTPQVFRSLNLAGRQPEPGTIERVDGAVIVSYSPFDLTARRRLSLAPLFVFLPAELAGNELIIEWSAAATAPHLVGRTEGELRVPVSIELLSPAEILTEGR